MDARAIIQNWDIDMTDDHIVLQQVMDDHCITVKRLCYETNRSERAIYKYRCGELTVPIFIWRKVFELTSDTRIAELLTGKLNYMLVKLPSVTNADAANVRNLAEITRAHAACMESLADILDDGVVDQKDKKHIDAFGRSVPELIKAVWCAKHAIEMEFKNCKKRSL